MDSPTLDVLVADASTCQGLRGTLQTIAPPSGCGGGSWLNAVPVSTGHEEDLVLQLSCRRADGPTTYFKASSDSTPLSLYDELSSHFLYGNSDVELPGKKHLYRSSGHNWNIKDARAPKSLQLLIFPFPFPSDILLFPTHVDRAIMARLFALFTLLVAAVATAAPLGNRAGLGSIKCNIDRFKIVTSLAATNLAVKQIDTSDNDTATAVGTAQTGLSSAADGIKTIALNIITGQTPSADARTQVQNGLNDAQTALTGINDSTASAAVASAQTKLAATIQDGNDVVADC